MSDRPRWLPRIMVGVLAVVVLALLGPRFFKRGQVVAPPTAEAAPAPEPPAKSEWCGESEALPSDVCYIDGRGNEGRRTLVIWLHGVIGKNTNWSQDHVKMLTRMSKATNIEMLFPKGILGEQVYAWPGTKEAQEKDEEALIAQWMNAKQLLEKRENKTFDETFIFGFSSGAYFASSLAMRGRADVDGYAVFAGGQPMPAASAPVVRFSPVFVGVCADDNTTASHSRAFAGSVAAAGIPRMVSEQSVGHDISPAHFTGALSFLRKSSGAKTTLSK